MNNRQSSLVFKFLAMLSGCLMVVSVVATIDISEALLSNIQNKYGAQAQLRVLNWQKLIQNGKNLTEQEKLTLVNDFFNQNVQFVDDSIHWHTEDYWATPLESLATGAGDCEDYSIAKYFTLIELGVDERKMRITYVKAYQLNQSHMVLTFFATPKSVPLVLDNLIPSIKPATQRTDLLPVYSFNGTGLWIAKDRGAGKQVGGSDRLSLWTELKQRMQLNELN